MNTSEVLGDSRTDFVSLESILICIKNISKPLSGIWRRVVVIVFVTVATPIGKVMSKSLGKE